MQLTTEIKTVEDAYQFQATVSSFDEIYQTDGDTIYDVLKSTMRREICSTARIGCYSGSNCMHACDNYVLTCILSLHYQVCYRSSFWLESPIMPFNSIVNFNSMDTT